MWGNEQDFWRYGRPKFWWPIWTYLFAAVFFTLFTMAGWMMAQLAASNDPATIFNFTVNYSLFGWFWLAWIIATAQPGRDQRLQLLRVGQRQPEPHRWLAALAPLVHRA